MLLRATLFACAVACASSNEVELTFSAPTLIATGSSAGSYADYGFSLSPTDLLFQTSARAFVVSTVGGESWTDSRVSCAQSLNGVPVSTQPGTLRNYGTVTVVKNETARYTAFYSNGATAYSLQPSGAFSCAAEAVNISFVGLPLPSSCDKAGAFGCPFRLGGGGQVTLTDGSLLYSAIVFWGSPDDKGVIPSSIVAYGSTNGGRTWIYRGTIADATDFPDSQEGPNENDISLLSDGSVACVFRLDAGDGPDTHPFSHYFLRTSTDGGRTWSAGALLPTAGSARPRLRHLGADGRGGISPAPLLLTGGRLRDAALGCDGWDIKLWVSAMGDGNFDEPHSLSYIHNSLAPSQWHFSAALNDSSAPRQSTSYTSIFELDGGPAPPRTWRRVGVSYNRALVNDSVYFLAFNVSW